MNPTPTNVLINPTNAARRQIDAAIRMTLAGEDRLSVYTVAYAGFRILCDLMENRGRDFVEDRWINTIAGLARELNENKTSPVLDDIREHDPAFFGTIEHFAGTLREKERAGESLKAEELVKVVVSHGVRDQYHKTMAGPANFLKHAEEKYAARRGNSYRQEEDFKHEEIVFDACYAYLDVMSSLTPEMLVYKAIYFLEHGEQPDSMPEVVGYVARELEMIDPKQKRAAALRLLMDTKSWEAIADILRLTSRT